MIGMPVKQLRLRIVRIKVEIPGFRVHQYDLVTTLTDADIYTKDELAELYFRRWAVELFFRQIKTTMGMEKLRCRTPEMARKELRMHLAYSNPRSDAGSCHTGINSPRTSQL